MKNIKVNEEQNSAIPSGKVPKDIQSDAALSGRELDVAVAERVMGLVPCQASTHAKGDLLPCHAQPDSPLAGGETKCYSSSIAAAMEVVERVRQWGVWTTIQVFHHTTQVRVEMGVPSSECQEWGASAAEAICKCALRAQSKFVLFAERLAALAAVSTQPEDDCQTTTEESLSPASLPESESLSQSADAGVADKIAQDYSFTFITQDDQEGLASAIYAALQSVRQQATAEIEALKAERDGLKAELQRVCAQRR